MFPSLAPLQQSQATGIPLIQLQIVLCFAASNIQTRALLPFLCSMAKLTHVFLPAGLKGPGFNTSRHLWISWSCCETVKCLFYFQWEQYAQMHFSKTGGKNLVDIHQNYRQEHVTQTTIENAHSKENCWPEPNMRLEGQHGLRNQIWGSP